MQYIGCFEVEKKNLMICDPMATKVSKDFYNVRSVNMAKIKLNSVENGIWYCYHVYDKKRTYPVGMLICHKSFDIKGLSAQKVFEEWNYEGEICCAFGNAVCVLDKNFFEESRYSYTLYDDNVVYRIKELKAWCEKEMPDGKEKNNLLRMLNLNSSKKYIEAAEISPYLDNCIPQIKHSTLWSIDCIFHCENQYMQAGTIKGGAVTRTSIDFSDVYSSPDSDAVYLSIDEGTPFFKQWHSSTFLVPETLFQVVV